MLFLLLISLVLSREWGSGEDLLEFWEGSSGSLGLGLRVWSLGFGPSDKSLKRGSHKSSRGFAPLQGFWGF